MKYYPLILIVILSLQSCCYTKNKAPTPKVETPNGYDQIRHKELNYTKFNTLTSNVGCNFQSENNTGSDLIHITKNNSTFDEDCWADDLPSVDWDNYDVVRCFMGAAAYTVYADMAYKVFISHEKKEILIKSSVTRSGACGSENEYYSWTRVFRIPKVPKDYTLRVEIKGAG